MQIILKINYSAYTYQFEAELILNDKSFEHWRLTAGNKVVVIQSNRPMLQAKGLKKKPITWKVVEGEVKDEKALAKVCKAIEDHLAGPPPQPPASSPFPNLPARVLLNQPNQRKKGGGSGPPIGERSK